MKNDKNHYKNNPIKKVIFRLDFEKIELALLNEFYDSYLKTVFPEKQEKEKMEVRAGVNLKTKELKQEKFEFSEWHFSNKLRDARFVVGNSYIFLEYDKYKDSKELFDHIRKIVLRFLTFFQVKTLKRVGLRYTNKLNSDRLKDSLFDWKEYIDNNLLGSLEFSKNKSLNLVRSMGQLIYNYDDALLVFNFGIWNDNYPGNVSKGEFILDLDYYSILPTPANEANIEEIAKLFNKRIQDIFEESITDSYKMYLNK